MRIECTIDGRTLTLALSSNKPLSLILNENLETFSVNSHCRGKMCGLCVVLIDGKAELSCLVPAFEIRGKEIITFSSYSKSKNIKDLEKAFELVGATPCEECYASQCLLFESLISSNETRPDVIKRETSIIHCSCLDPDDRVAIVTKAVELRRKRHGRRS